ncbi:MAG TPA: hypothetical protein VFF27_07605, partial [Bacteroidia bacterium]|nr:hypothetical protein [Bacteroidia bacterium]
MIVTFALVTFAWIFFRAATFQDAMIIIDKIKQLNFTFSMPQITTKLGSLNLVVSVFLIVALFFSYILPRDLNLKHKALFFIFMTILIITLGTNGTGNFIYFQF